MYANLLTKFLDEWNEAVKNGAVSPLSGIELAALRLFANWLDEEEKGDDDGRNVVISVETPHRGLDVTETV